MFRYMQEIERYICQNINITKNILNYGTEVYYLSTGNQLLLNDWYQFLSVAFIVLEISNIGKISFPSNAGMCSHPEHMIQIFRINDSLVMLCIRSGIKRVENYV